jgi:serine/threonine protein kinase
LAEAFRYGLEKFLEEARVLARFAEHQGIVAVRDFFPAHGTGYLVMSYLEGLTLKDYLARQGGQIPFPQALAILMPVMDALRAVHQVGLLHRDISPDNIYITRDRQVKLIDFGAARAAMGAHSRSLSVILKPGYAPPEQYGSQGRQGPWTDVYAVGATLYQMLTGQMPPEAPDRLYQDTLKPPTAYGADLPQTAELALFKALAVRAEQRFQSVADLQAALVQAAEGQAIESPATMGVPSPPKAPKPATPQPDGQKSSFEKKWILAAVGVGVFGVLLLVQTLTKNPTPTDSTTPKHSQTQTPPPVAQTQPKEQLTPLQQWQKRANAGDAMAQFILGMMYDNGQSVPQNDTQAAYWYRKAADQGDAKAQYNLGVMYDNGQGVPQNDTQAAYWTRKAADQGHAGAQFNLGLMYDNGQGVPQDDAQAAYWFRKAADQGEAKAQFNLGVMYANGQGVPQNDAQAAYWLRKAADQGHAQAKAALKRLTGG